MSESEKLGDYPVVEMAEVEPVFVRQMILGAMAIRYMRAAALDQNEGFNAARATWNVEWETDPAPRTFEQAIEQVDGDLEYWDEGA